VKIAVFGVGGAAGYFGARLAQAGEDVAFIARGEHLRAIQENGLQVESAAGPFSIQPANATDDPTQVGPVDAVILGVKTWQVEESAKAMSPLIGSQTVVVPLQNGIETCDQLSSHLGSEHVLGGSARIIGFIVEPGRLRQVGGLCEISFGELDNRSTERTERLREVFEAAGIRTVVPKDIQVTLWAKFMAVTALGGIGAVTRAPAEVLVRLPETRQLLVSALEEVARLGAARGVALNDEHVRAAMATFDGLPAGSTMSLQRDIVAGRPSELEAWNGSVVRLGRSAGVPVPTHDFVYEALLPQERRARGQEDFD
jgi:2-dehydropantoate 2-reductase